MKIEVIENIGEVRRSVFGVTVKHSPSCFPPTFPLH